MNTEAVKQELRQQFPGVTVKENANDRNIVTEIVGEIDRQLVWSERDVAVVVADSSVEHYHKHTTEEYVVLRGILRVFRNGQPTDLKVGESIIIEPGTKHRVEGDETWFYCFSVPDWSPDDFYLVKQDS